MVDFVKQNVLCQINDTVIAQVKEASACYARLHLWNSSPFSESKNKQISLKNIFDNLCRWHSSALNKKTGQMFKLSCNKESEFCFFGSEESDQS